MYRPVNTPDKITDPDRWQPIPFVNEDGTTFAPGFLTPQPIPASFPKRLRRFFSLPPFNIHDSLFNK